MMMILNVKYVTIGTINYDRGDKQTASVPISEPIV